MTNVVVLPNVLLELKPNSEQIWTQVESDLTRHQQGEPDKAFWGRFIQKTVGNNSNYTQDDLREARKRGYEEGREDGEEHGSDINDQRIKRNAEKWEQLEEAGIDWLYGVSEEDIRELKQARELLKLLEEDGYRSVQSQFENLVESVRKVGTHIDRLEEATGIEPESPTGTPSNRDS